MRAGDPAGSLDGRVRSWTLRTEQERLHEIGVDFALTGLRNLRMALGMKTLMKVTSRETGRGLVGYYDPLECLVIFTVQHRADGSTIKEIRERLDNWRDVAEKAVFGKLDYGPRGRGQSTKFAWGWLVESTAHYLFLSDLRHGLDLRTLQALVSSRPEVLTYTLDGDRCLEAVLRAYASRVIADTAHVVVKPEDINFFDDGRPPIYRGSFQSTDTLEILDSLGCLEPRMGPSLLPPYVARKPNPSSETEPKDRDERNRKAHGL